LIQFIPGIGDKNAATILSEIGDINLFEIRGYWGEYVNSLNSRHGSAQTADPFLRFTIDTCRILPSVIRWSLTKEQKRIA